jgi:hypothetical protein
MTFLALLFAFLPKPRFRISYYSGYSDLYYSLQKKVVAWHKSELEELDASYASVQDSLRLVNARRKAVADGISPLDPKYPSLEDVSPRFKKMLSE